MLREFLHNILTRELYLYLWTCWLVLIMPVVPEFMRSLAQMPYQDSSGNFIMVSVFCFCGPFIVPLYTVHLIGSWILSPSAAMTEQVALWILKILAGFAISWAATYIWDHMYKFRHSPAGEMTWRWLVVYCFAAWLLYLLTLTGLMPLAPVHLPLYVISLLCACFITMVPGPMGVAALAGMKMHPLLALLILALKFALSYAACWLLLSLWEWQRAIPGTATSDINEDKAA
ncbi:MAG: hypothetical protein ACAI35_23480 [Candidatus Methylacidiphilales bacterium]|nr:hypothetical protein [Candidatus Methylacidiphilales bacterium]